MGAGEREIICRRCNETISRDVDSCPHCGASIRRRRGPIVALVIGLVIAGATVFDIGNLWPYTLLGLIVAFGGGYFLYDQWNRMQEA